MIDCCQCQRQTECPAFTQKYKILECVDFEVEIEQPMFPKGIHQLLGWSYAMQGIDPHEPSVHARMITMADEGIIKPVMFGGVNIKGMR